MGHRTDINRRQNLHSTDFCLYNIILSWQCMRLLWRRKTEIRQLQIVQFFELNHVFANRHLQICRLGYSSILLDRRVRNTLLKPTWRYPYTSVCYLLQLDLNLWRIRNDIYDIFHFLLLTYWWKISITMIIILVFRFAGRRIWRNCRCAYFLIIIDIRCIHLFKVFLSERTQHLYIIVLLFTCEEKNSWE